MFTLLKSLFGGPSVDYKSLLQKGAVIIDVRSRSEFNEGHIKGSQNIPLDQLASKLSSIKNRKTPVITVCRSGGRSAMGKSFLSKNGIECYNGGSWNSLESKLS